MKILSVAQPNLIYLHISCELSWNYFARTLYLSWYLIKYLHDVMKLSIVKYIRKHTFNKVLFKLDNVGKNKYSQFYTLLKSSNNVLDKSFVWQHKYIDLIFDWFMQVKSSEGVRDYSASPQV